MAINWQAQSLAQTQSQSNNADVAMSKILKKKTKQKRPMMMQGTPLKHFIYELDWISKSLKILVLI